MNGTSHCLLVVDDEPEIRRELAEYFSERGYKVLEAGNGAEGFARYQAEPIDAIITDMRMPRGTGRELIRRVREIDPALPVIVMMGHNSEEESLEALGSGADAVFRKPLRLRDLRDTLAALLGETAPSTSPARSP